MINNNDVLVLCKTENNYLALGVRSLIECASIPGEKVVICDEFSEENICRADYIIITTMPALLYFCLADLRFRNPRSIVIAIFDRECSIHNDLICYCAHDVIVIDNRKKTQILKEELIHKIANRNASALFQFNPQKCAQCQIPRLTDTQLEFINFHRNGYNAKAISKMMNVSDKKVYSYKYMIGAKYCLRGDYELYGLLNLVSHQEILVGVVRFVKRIIPI